MGHFLLINGKKEAFVPNAFLMQRTCPATTESNPMNIVSDPDSAFDMRATLYSGSPSLIPSLASQFPSFVQLFTPLLDLVSRLEVGGRSWSSAHQASKRRRQSPRRSVQRQRAGARCSCANSVGRRRRLAQCLNSAGAAATTRASTLVQKMGHCTAPFLKAVPSSLGSASGTVRKRVASSEAGGLCRRPLGRLRRQ